MKNSVSRVIHAPGLITAAVFASSLIAAGLSFASLLSVVLATGVVTTIAGGLPWAGSRTVDLTEQLLFGMTVVLGLISLATILTGGTRSMPGLLTLIFLIIVGVILRCRGRHYSEPVDHESLLVLMLITLVSLVTKMWFFMTPLAVVLAMVLSWLVLRRRHERLGQTRFVVGVLLLIIGSGLLSRMLALSDRAEGAIFRSYDQYFRASVAHTVMRFGLGDHPGARGYPLRYHWLSEANMALMSEGTPTIALELVLRFSALGAVLATVIGVHVLARDIGLSKTEGYFAAVLVAVLSTILYSYGLNVLKPTEMGQLWGTPQLLVTVILLIRFHGQRNLRSAVLLLLGVVTLMMTNATAGLVGVTVIALVMGLKALREREISREVFFLLALLGFIALLIRRTLLVSQESDTYSPEFSSLKLFEYAGKFGYIGTNSWIAALTVLALVLTMWFQSGASLGFRHFGVKVRGTPTSHNIFETIAVVGFLLATFIALGSGEQYRFLLPILIVGPIAAGATLQQSVQWLMYESRGILFTLLVFGLVLGGVASQFTSKAFGGATFMAPRIVFIVVLLVSPIGLWLTSRIIRRPARFALNGTAPQLATFFLAMSVVVGVAHTVNETRGQYAYVLGLEAQSVIHADRFACLEVLRNASPVDAVIASNMWKWEDDAATEKWYIATAVAERRSYLDGPLYVQDPRSSWLQDRADLTMRFASAPTVEDFRVLRSFDVEYFVADKERSVTSSWKGYGTVIFSNDTCDVVRLNDDAS